MKARSEPYMKSQEVADVLGITKRTLMNWLRTQKIPGAGAQPGEPLPALDRPGRRTYPANHRGEEQ